MLGLGLMAASAAAAAEQPPPDIPDAVVRKLVELGLENIHRALCDGFNQCAPATPAEFANPPVTIEQAKGAVLAGSRTAYARWCRLDANRRSILPMTRQLRELKFNERQTALMAIVHGIQQDLVFKSLRAQGRCDEATRSKLDAQLPKA
jgi:hypothetical protein